MTGPALTIVPVTFREACAFVAERTLRGVAPPAPQATSRDEVLPRSARRDPIVGRPVARCLDDRRTAEVNRTCTDGCPNANSALYGACRRVAFAMGYTRLLTYTQEGESGASLRAAGFRLVREIPPRPSWAASTKDERLRQMRDPEGPGSVARFLWEVVRGA